MTGKSEREIRRIIACLGEIKAAKEALSQEEGALWGAFYDVADTVAGKEQPYRFLDAEAGLVLARVLTERLDVGMLEERLSDAAWKAVTVPARRFERALLEAALLRGNVSAEIMEDCTERSLRRYGPAPATKEERFERKEEKP